MSVCASVVSPRAPIAKVPFAEIDKGYEVASGEYVIVTPDELEAVEPGRNRSIEIEDFVALDEIDPVYFDSTYMIAPADEGAARPYRVLQAPPWSSPGGPLSPGS